MTKAIPREAHPDLDKWIAHVDESKIALYSWPASDLKDLEEGKMPFRVAPALHKEFDKLIQLHYAEELSECPTAVVNPAVVGAVTCYYEKPVPNICCQKTFRNLGGHTTRWLQRCAVLLPNAKGRAKRQCLSARAPFWVRIVPLGGAKLTPP
jgi:hypothetical protein